VIDETPCECLTIELARSFTAQNVTDVLQYLFAIRGTPQHLGSDNGPEFVAKSVCRWRLHYIHHRIHRALDYQTPAPCGAGCVFPVSITPQPPEHSHVS